jgi:ribosomal protein S12 methylthiotransferase accessory factor
MTERRLPHARPADVDVVVTPLGVHDELSAPARPRTDGRSVPVQVYGNHAILGPVRAPGATAPGCAQCLARRWQAIRPTAVRDAIESGGVGGPVGGPPVPNPFAAEALAALARAAVEDDDESRVFPFVYRLDVDTLQLRRFPLIPDTACPTCGSTQESGNAGTVVGPAPKASPTEFRLRSLADFALPVTAFANPVCGMLGSGVSWDLGSVTTAATAGVFGVRTGDRLYEIFWGGHATTFRDSTRIGILEGLERQAGMRSPAESTVVTASLADLRADGVAAVDPVTCGLYSDEFHSAHPEIPPFSADRVIRWVPGHSLRDRAGVLVPEVLTYYYSSAVADRFVQECSNGCASGSSLVESVYFGLMELLERDAFLLAWYGMAALPEIDPMTSGDPRTREMVDRLTMYGYQARFFDGRMTFPIPVVIGTALRADGDLGALCFGAGAGLDAESALRSALVEVATDGPPLRKRTRWNLASLRAMAADFDLVGSVHDHPLVFGLPEMARHASFLLAGRPTPSRSVTDLATDTPTPSADLADCVELLAEQGFDVVAVEQTTPEQRAVGVHTASVLVPGLLPIDFGWQRQRALRMPRMRTALRMAGLRTRDLEPADLNPVPHPFP